MNLRRPHFQQSAFTLVEIAISLAIIGIALVAIIGVLPLGMNVQRDNREQTVINQDATVFIEAIRNGSRGLDDLTNYVYAITNFWTLYNLDGSVSGTGKNGYSSAGVLMGSGVYPNTPYFSVPLNSGSNIVALLSTPEFIANILNTRAVRATNYPGVPGLFYVSQRYGPNYTCYSNHIVASVRSLSGPAVEKPPQDNDIIQADSFSYRLYCVNAPVAMDTNVFNLPPNNSSRIYASQLAENLHELRLTFLWPIHPNGALGNGRQTYRTLITGPLQLQFYYDANLNQNLVRQYFYQPQSFTNAP